jgi:two-component system KDP operon response regulator KdpE
MDRKILVVDDEPTFVSLVSQTLIHQEYEVIGAKDGQEALRLLFAHKPDLVLLDMDMPGLDGWQTCQRIRDMCDIPVIMLTGRHNTEEDIVRGLDHGADDYIIKPMGFREMLARVRAVLRRAELPTPSRMRRPAHSDSWLTLDVAKHRVIVNGERVRLTPTEFRLLTALVENADRVLTHQLLLEKVWGREYVDDLDHVRIYIWHLRQKIEPDPAQPRYIITEPGVGYYFQKPGEPPGDTTKPDMVNPSLAAHQSNKLQ